MYSIEISDSIIDLLLKRITRLNENEIKVLSCAAVIGRKFEIDLLFQLLKKIEINDDGGVSYWPENIFSESLGETLAIRTAQLNKSNDEESYTLFLVDAN